uniref:Uncharacterized protein n=1 Tax=Meloidogyne javanica TaxID=6303 RepID=A0A915MRX0_MELJA
MQHKRIGFSSFPVQMPSSLSSFPIPPPPLQLLPTSSLSLPNSSLSLPNSSLSLPSLLPPPKKKETSRKRRRSSFSCDGTKKLIPFTEVEWKYVQRKFMNEDQHTLMELTNIMNMWLDRCIMDIPIEFYPNQNSDVDFSDPELDRFLPQRNSISISELVLRALVLDQKRHGAKGSVGLDNADVGLILCS